MKRNANNSISEKLLSAIPKFILLNIILIITIPFSLGYMNQYLPSIDFIIIFYFTIYRNENMSKLFIFLVGLVQDFVTAPFLGVSSLIAILFQNILEKQRKLYLRENFLFIFVNFSILCFLYSVCKWIIFSVVLKEMIPFKNIFGSFLLTLPFYLIIQWMLNRYYFKMLKK